MEKEKCKIQNVKVTGIGVNKKSLLLKQRLCASL